MRHLYLHIPFCKSLCPYCDFYTVLNNVEKQSLYTAALLKELVFFHDYFEEPLETIYFGGGTPSLLEAVHLKAVFEYLRKLKWSPSIEITFEANPLTIDQEKCKMYRDLGINRVSLGTQSFVDSELKTLGRQHRNKDNYNAFELLRKAGFKNINLDLLIGIPGQNTVSLQNSLEQIVKLDSEHISPYILTYYEDTVYTKMLAKGKIQAADNETEAELFDQADSFVTKNGFARYEISNFAKPGYFSKHNLNTWQFGEYLGVGCAAHSFFNRSRRANPADITDYLKLAENDNWRNGLEPVSASDQIGEYIMLALRTVDGLALAEFQKLFKQDFCQLFTREYKKHIQSGGLIRNGDRIYLSKKGMDLFNNVVSDFML